MIPYQPGKLTIFPDPANDRLHFTFIGPDPISVEEAEEMQAANDRPAALYGIGNHGWKRTDDGWITSWWCRAHPMKDANA